MNPPFGPPHGERLARVNAEEIKRRIAPFRRELRTLEPACWELVAAVGEILPAEDTKLEHFGGASAPVETRD